MVDLTPAFEGLTDVERLFVAARLKGLATHAAAKAAGVSSDTAVEWGRDERLNAAIERGRKAIIDDVAVTRERVVRMFLDAYDMAETAGEKVAAARELGKMLGFYEAKKVAITHDVKNIKGAEQLRQLPIEVLERIAKGELVIEGEFTEVPMKPALKAIGRA